VRLDAVDRKTDHLHVALVELGFDLGDIAELGGAHRREVLGMAEQHSPRLTEPIVKADLALGSRGSEVGCDVSEANGHGEAPELEGVEF